MSDLDLLIDAARASGDVARPFFGAKPRVWDKGNNAGPVTEADLAVNTMLWSRLHNARPTYGWLSEETEDDGARIDTEYQFIIDPIDGTRAFIDGSRDWAHSLAIAQNGRVTAAAVYLPMHDLLFAASAGGGATLNNATIRAAATTDVDTAAILAARPTYAITHWAGGRAPAAKRHFRSSLAYRLCLVAQGRFDAMITLRPTWEWDVAAGALIVTEAGGIASDRKGRPLQFNNTHPQVNGIIAAGDVHQPLIDRLA